MADASTDQPGLLEAAMAFLRGETVAKSSLLTAQARATQLESTLTDSVALVKDLNAKLAKSEASLVSSASLAKELTEQISAQAEEIATLKATAITGARQAAVILSGVGITPLASSTETARDKATEKTFADLVQDQVKAGHSKIKAIQIVMVSSPDAYKSYLKTGGKL